MSIRIRITYLGKEISFSEALLYSYIRIEGNEIIANENVVISISSKLYDWNDMEIFENDIVKDSKGKVYKIIYDYGMFYFSDPQTNEIIMPLSICKLENKIDVEIIK